jgi:hypothetical protein
MALTPLIPGTQSPHSQKRWVEEDAKEEMQHHNDITGLLSPTRTEHCETIVWCRQEYITRPEPHTQRHLSTKSNSIYYTNQSHHLTLPYPPPNQPHTKCLATETVHPTTAPSRATTSCTAAPETCVVPPPASSPTDSPKLTPPRPDNPPARQNQRRAHARHRKGRRYYAPRRNCMQEHKC